MKDNRQIEQSMVEAVKRSYPQLYNEENSSRNVQGQTNKCDLAIQFNGITYYLETKHSHESNTANYAKQMLSECLINRKHHGSNQSYGILVDMDAPPNLCLLNYIKKHMAKEDWNAFGKQFNCTIIFLYKEKTMELYYMAWEGLFDNMSPIPIKK